MEIHNCYAVEKKKKNNFPTLERKIHRKIIENGKTMPKIMTTLGIGPEGHSREI